MSAGVVGSLSAGEAIVFGNAKSKVEPSKDKAPVESFFRMDKLTSPGSDFGTITPPILPRINSNPRKDKRQQNAEDEKKNWLILDKGELQEKDDEKNFLGLRDDDLEDLDKSKDSRDYTFRENGPSKSPGQSRTPGTQSRRSGPGRKDANQAPNPRENIEEDDVKRASRSSAIVFGARDGAAKGMDLKSLLGTPDRSDFSTRDFGSGGDLPSTRDQQSRMDTFKQMLNGSSGPGSVSDSLNRPDFTSQHFTPVMPSFGDSSRKAFAPDSFTATPRQTFGQPNSSPNYLGSPDSSSRGSTFGAPLQPASGWKPTPVEWQPRRF